MVTNIAAILNSGFNPVIYTIRLKQFKEAFQELLHMKKKSEETSPSGEGIEMIDTMSNANNAQNNHEGNNNTN